jgi:phosphatidylglycerol---prolipoprotein diacylglyceryl transferase
MSFHGGIIGVVLGLLYFAYRTKTSLLLVGDEVAITIPIGIGLGRIANFLNNELVGYAGYTGPL